MKRFDRNELTYKRSYEALKRRIMDIPNAMAWYLPDSTSKYNKNKLMKYANIHCNDRCFILGNGPSLKKIDFNLLRNEYTFGLNRIYLLFDEIQFQSSYYVSINELVLEQFANDIKKLTMPKFLNWNRRSFFSEQDDKTMYVRTSLRINDFFQNNPAHSLCSGGTVTYIALQLAFFMGFKEVILIGVDHSFAYKGVPNTTEVRSSDSDLSHFHPSYFPKGSRWQLPDLQRSEMAYQLARAAYEKAGRQVYDATIGGKCPVFQKVDFLTLFS